ncbi:MAG: hypothetical protein IJ787_05505 [Bacilli bacterium]|nr:hypothetical protein [Bacilli bacterium]
MKIVIRSMDGPKHLTLRFPLVFLKTRLAARILANNDEFKIDAKELHKRISSAYKFLKSYIKKNGHFDLVNVRSHEGDHIQIRL